MRVFLVGFMGAGKTTVGRKLARHLGFTFIDLDQAFEEKFHFSIYNFFDRFGEDKFREIEHQLLLEIIAKHDNTVISTGGGTPCFYDNMKIMKGHGLTVYIKMHEASLADRLIVSKRRRPALKGLNKEEMKIYIQNLLDARKEYYHQADFTIKGENLDIDQLLVFLKGKGKRIRQKNKTKDKS